MRKLDRRCEWAIQPGERELSDDRSIWRTFAQRHVVVVNGADSLGHVVEVESCYRIGGDEGPHDLFVFGRRFRTPNDRHLLHGLRLAMHEQCARESAVFALAAKRQRVLLARFERDILCRQHVSW